ncbi:MAG: winged helix-turn-helix transcriptional regulator [Candidatus Altiarchaeota archaeon]|nr:winged helix-turn-helix transcriptional regulator [Candidatus Altiarchaeota archaeon]
MFNKDTCKVESINKEAVSEAMHELPDGEIISRISESFKVLGGPTRVKILCALSKRELCVCDLAELLGATHSATSHQLRVLKNWRWIKFRKAGKMVHYSLADKHVINLINMSIRHARE